MKSTKLFVARTLEYGDRIVTPVDTSVPDLPLVMTIEEAAAMLRTTSSSIRLAIANGELPTMRLAGRDRIISAKMMERFYKVEKKRKATIAAR